MTDTISTEKTPKTARPGRDFVIPARIETAFLNDNPLLLTDALFDVKAVIRRALSAGYLAAYRDSQDPNDSTIRPIRDEYTERFVRQFARLSSKGHTRNRQLDVAFRAWVEHEQPELAPLILSKHCTRSLHRKLDHFGLGKRGRLVDGPGRLHVTLDGLPAYAVRELESLAPRENNRVLFDLYPIIACWVEDHAYETRPDSPDLAAMPASVPLSDCAESVRKHYGDEAPVERASNRAINRVVNKILDERNIGTRAVNNGSAARRGLRILPRPIEDHIAQDGRDYWLHRIVLRD